MQPLQPPAPGEDAPDPPDQDAPDPRAGVPKGTHHVDNKHNTSLNDTDLTTLQPGKRAVAGVGAASVIHASVAKMDKVSVIFFCNWMTQWLIPSKYGIACTLLCGCNGGQLCQQVHTRIAREKAAAMPLAQADAQPGIITTTATNEAMTC
jgi:hypothetical protein